MSASGRRTVIVSVAALAVAVVLVLAATTGPSGLVEEQPGGADNAQTTRETPDEEQSSDEASDDDPESERDTGFGQWVRDFLWFALFLIGLALTMAALRALALRLSRELFDKRLVLDLEPLPDVEAGREAVRRDLEAYAAALAGSDVRNGIVACWVLLEQTASELGVIRRPSETATEFVVRFLHTLDVDPRPVAALAALYQEARFSTHALPDVARHRAEASLRGIRADLDRSTAP
jgi:uncharacterized protein DUF4129